MDMYVQELYLEGDVSISLELLLGCSHSERIHVADLAATWLSHKAGYKVNAMQAVKAIKNGLPVRAVVHDGCVNSLHNVVCEEKHILAKLVEEYNQLKKHSDKELLSLSECLEREKQELVSFKAEHDRVMSYWKQRAFSAEGRIR